jgi:peptidoglycan hydrolase CwlO-like protein
LSLAEKLLEKRQDAMKKRLRQAYMSGLSSFAPDIELQKSMDFIHRTGY